MKTLVATRTNKQSNYILPASVMTAPTPARQQVDREEEEYQREYAAWKQANGMPDRVSRRDYEVLFIY